MNSSIIDYEGVLSYRARASGIDGGVRWEGDACVWETLASADGKRRFPGLSEESIACVSIPQGFFGSFFDLKERTMMQFIFTKQKMT